MEQVTIKDIAKICNVGVTTVSRAINDHPDINSETKQRIMDAIREYHYFPNNSARNLKRSENQTIAVLVKGISNPFFGPIIEVLEREIIRRHFSFVLQQVEEEEDEVEAAISLEKEKRLKGIIFLGGSVHHTSNRLRLVRIPSVISTVDTQIPPDIENCAVVSIDDEAESYKMVDHLCRSGHKRIAILTASERDNSIGKKRLEASRLHEHQHGHKVQILSHQRIFDLTQGIVDLARGKSHLEGKKLSRRAERRKNQADEESHYYSNHALAKKKEDEAKIERAFGSNKSCV